MGMRKLWGARCVGRIKRAWVQGSHQLGGTIQTEIYTRGGHMLYSRVTPELFRLIADNLRPWGVRGNPDYTQPDARRVIEYLTGLQVRIRIECMETSKPSWDHVILGPRVTILESVREQDHQT